MSRKILDSSRFNNELTLNITEFNRFDIKSNLYAFAQQVQNICLIEKGTYPNLPQLGVGIENYEFENGSSYILDKIKDEIDEAIADFVPNNFDVEITVELQDIMSKQYGQVVKILVIHFDMSNPSNTVNKDTDDTSFSLVFGRNDRNSKLVSKLII